MGLFSLAKLFGITIRESATDGSDFTNPDADYRRLFLGEDGMLHVKDSSGTVTAPYAAGGGGALVLLEQHTAASSATLDFTTCISSTYDDYQIEMVNVIPATDGVGLQMLASTDGGSTWLAGTTYGWYVTRYNAVSGGVNGQASAGTTSIPVDGYASGLAGNTAAYGGVCGTLHLINPLNASASKSLTIDDAYRAVDGSPMRIMGAASIQTNTAVNALRFLMSSGNIASGTIRVYGIAKS